LSCHGGLSANGKKNVSIKIDINYWLMTILFKSCVSENNTFIQQGCIIFIKSDGKEFYIVIQKKSISNNSILSMNQNIQGKCITASTETLNSTTVFIINNKCFLSTTST